MFDNLSDDALLNALDKERQKFTASDQGAMRQMVEALIARKVYPAETPEGNPNDIYSMVSGWGARWHEWRGPFECPHCKADLRDHRTGPPFKREVGHYDMGRDRTTGFSCPDCKENLHATLSLESAPS